MTWQPGDMAIAAGADAAGLSRRDFGEWSNKPPFVEGAAYKVRAVLRLEDEVGLVFEGVAGEGLTGAWDADCFIRVSADE